MNTSQTWNATDYASNARFVADLGAPVLELLAPQPGERILDVGCGDGALTERIGQAGASVVGVDSSTELLGAAQARGLEVQHKDAQALDFDQEFDAVFTNATLHWMTDLKAALTGAHRALRPGGRFVGEFGGHGCMAAVCTALRASAAKRQLQLKFPWVFPTAKEFHALLEQSGFYPLSVELIPRPTPLPSGMSAWLHTFARPLLNQFPTEEAETVKEEVLQALSGSLRDSSGNWTADYVRLRFSATLQP